MTTRRHRPARRPLALGAAALLATGTALLAVPGTASAEPAYAVTVLSSSPDQVTGGDARIRVDVPPGVVRQAVVRLNGADVTAQLTQRSGQSLEGVVSGMRLGGNEVAVYPTATSQGAPAKARAVLTNFPKEGPVFSGPQQYPFVCKTDRPIGELPRLGQPIVDNDSYGYTVFTVDAAGNKTGQIAGYSKDCSAPDRVDLVYRTAAGTFKPLPSGAVPADAATTTLLDGRTVPYVVRWERGTINRFVYSIAMLVDPARPTDDSLWNKRLTYSFDGGVAIGHSQGELSLGNSFQQSLGLGYAVISSSGTRMSVHYNLQVGGETALMVKEEFVERHGVPLYTIGVGGSGGAIQQYVYGQNHKRLLDAAVPQYSYPDMTTQTIHVGDCELLEHYFDVLGSANPKWKDPEIRQAVEGMNVTGSPKNLSSGDIAKWSGIYGAQAYLASLGMPFQVMTPDPGSPFALGECRQGWFGLTPLAMNPTYGSAGAGSELMAPPGVMNTVKWTHFDDLRNVYGVDADGFAKVPWDNVGVQYGLQALRNGVITPAEFLDLNAKVGGWKKTRDMVAEGFPFTTSTPTPTTFDPWSSRNMLQSPDGGASPAARSTGDVSAMNGAYRSGIYFDGRIDIPIIDWRHYLEDELNMHNTHQSFASRQRIIDAKGEADNQVIWFTDARPRVSFDQTAMAFQVMDQWLANIRSYPELSVAQNKPADAVDRCFNTDGSEYARGTGVWDGVLDTKPAGACTKKFPLYSTSRIVAGGPIRGGVYKCAVQPVEDAVAKGLYGGWVPTASERSRLQSIFPSGVCDYSGPDAGRPTG